MSGIGDSDGTGVIGRLPRAVNLGLARREVSLFHPFFPLGELSRLSAARMGADVDRALEDVESLVLFIGYGRSGHSLLGALLDAHPEMAIAHELYVARYVAHGFSQEEIFRLLVENSRVFASFGRVWGRYRYEVPGQWQGRWRRLRVLGDKKGGGTGRLLTRRPELLDAILERFDRPIRFIHVTRHPYDLVARNWMTKRLDAQGAVDLIMNNCETVRRVQRRVGADQWLDSPHEQFVARPRETLERICRFLGVEPDEGYLDACTAIVGPKPQTARGEVDWPPGIREQIAERASAYPFMQRYFE